MEERASKFLKLIGIPISEVYVKKLIRSHPNFPSLLSVSDTYQRLGIKHLVWRIEKENVKEVPFPFLLPLNGGGILIIKKESDLDRYKDDLKHWTGVILQAEPTKNINDRTNNELYAKESQIRKLIIGLIAIVSVFISFPLFLSFTWLSIILLMTTISGLTVSYFLLAKELGVTYEAVEAFCNAGKNTNCDRILKSDVSLFGVKFSEAVPLYFIFQLIVITLIQVVPSSKTSLNQLLAWLSLFVLPFTIFSLYYQYFIAKSWCRLCLIVAAITIVQFVIFSLGSSYLSPQLLDKIQFIPTSILLLIFASIWLSVILMMRIIERANRLERLEGSGNRVKYSAPVFEQLLLQQKQIDPSPFEKEILFGSVDAPVKLVMVSNLYCEPCKEKHKVVEELISMYPHKVSVALRFVRSNNDVVGNMNSVSYLLGSWLSYCSGKEDESEKTAVLINDWFNIWDLQKFAKKYTIDKEMENICTRMDAQHHAWAQEAYVSRTPTFFLNGYELPNEYSIDDMMTMAPIIADEMVNRVKNERVLQNSN